VFAWDGGKTGSKRKSALVVRKHTVMCLDSRLVLAKTEEPLHDH